jgi:methylmalonyl-CoA mutase N-terminal domain/subunit
VGDAARSESGQPVQAVYGADALDGFDLLTQMGYDRRGIDSGVRTVVGVNKFAVSGDEPYEPLRARPQIEADQCQRLAVLRAERDNQAATRALSDLRRASDGNRQRAAAAARRARAARHRRRDRARPARRVGRLPAARNTVNAADRKGVIR